MLRRVYRQLSTFIPSHSRRRFFSISTAAALPLLFSSSAASHTQHGTVCAHQQEHHQFEHVTSHQHHEAELNCKTNHVRNRKRSRKKRNSLLFSSLSSVRLHDNRSERRRRQRRRRVEQSGTHQQQRRQTHSETQRTRSTRLSIFV